MGPGGAGYQLYGELTDRTAARDAPRMMTTSDLEAFFSRGWNRHDVECLMTFMAEECVFESASGPEPCGGRHVGREQVRRAFARVFEAFPDVQFGTTRHVVAGDRGLSEWRFTGTTPEGRRVDVDGCDLFTFAGDKIARKSSFLKTRTG
jgi:ketosteroid isomerase-like protein